MNPLKIDALIFPRWIIPVEPENTVLEKHIIAIHEGKILDILPENNAHIYDSKEKIVLSNHALLPGFINAHAHTPMTLFRGWADDLTLMDWLNHHIWPAEKKWVGDEFCYDGATLAILEMLQSGTTCFNDNYFFLESIGKAAQDSHIRASLGVCILDFPTNYANTLTEYLSKAESLIQQYQNNHLISVNIAPHAPYTVSNESFKLIKTLADKHHAILQIHCHETQIEITDSLKQYQLRPLERLQQLEILSPRTQAVHCVVLSEGDIEILKETGTHVVHCPESNLKLASGFSPIQKCLENKINVALGTDGAASNNDLDMLGEMKTAAILAKAVSGNSQALNAFDALKMATLNGAKAMGIEKLTGSLTKNKQADMIAIDLLSYANTQPIYHPISQIVYAAHAQQITDVWVNGKRLIQNKHPVYLDKTEIFEKANRWREKIYR